MKDPFFHFTEMWGSERYKFHQGFIQLISSVFRRIPSPDLFSQFCMPIV